MRRIHGEDGAEPLYADEDGPGGPIQITQPYAKTVGGRAGGPRARFKVPWKDGGYYILQRKTDKKGMLTKLEGNYE